MRSSQHAAVVAGMEILVWDVHLEEWNQSLAQRRAYLRSKDDDGHSQQREWASYYRFRDQPRPGRVLFTSTGVICGEVAHAWRSRWWRLDRIRMSRAGWETLHLRWRHVWRIAHRALTVPLPPSARTHVTGMLEVIAERLPSPSEVEFIVEPGNEDGSWFAQPG